MNTSSFAPKLIDRPPLVTPVTNAMSVDVEDYFQVQALTGAFPRQAWDDIPLRVAQNTQTIIDLFDRHGVKATFFTLGWIAERIPETIRRIVEGGHELAAHGYEHRRIFEQTPDEFRHDIRRTKEILENIGGTQVRGYRAATFSISRASLWAYDILAEEGYTYSSSVYPIRHDLYGMPDAPRFPFWVGDEGGMREYPITTVQLGGRNFPGGGGGYFRLAPYDISKAIITRTNRRDRQPFMFYFHPWEVDPDQPRPGNVALKSRLRHYTNLKVMEAKLNRLLSDFKWDRVDRTFEPAVGGEAAS